MLRAWAEREVGERPEISVVAPLFSVPVLSSDGDADAPDRLARSGAKLLAREEVTAFCTSSKISRLKSSSSRSSIADARRVQLVQQVGQQSSSYLQYASVNQTCYER